MFTEREQVFHSLALHIQKQGGEVSSNSATDGRLLRSGKGARAPQRPRPRVEAADLC
jgi:hypothetical protein